MTKIDKKKVSESWRSLVTDFDHILLTNFKINPYCESSAWAREC